MYLNVNNPVNYQLQGFGQNGVRTISTDQLYIQGEYYRVLVAEEDSYVTAVSVLGDDLTAEFVYAGTTIYGLFTEVSVSSGSLTAYIAGPTDIEDVWAYINAYGQTNAARIEAADCAKDAIAPLLDKYYAKASLVMVPSLYKTSIVYSERPLTTDGQLAFTRSNDTATRVGPDGYIEKVRTNLILQSQAFNTTWTSISASVTANTTVNPLNGAVDADTITLTGATTQKYVTQAFSLNGNYTASVYLKAGTHQFAQIMLGTDTAPIANFDLTNGTSSATNSTAKIVSVGGGWYRCSMSFTSTTGTTVFILAVDSLSASRFATTASTGTLIAFGYQLETGDIATDYIPTTASAVSVGPVANLPRLNYPINSDGSVGCPSLLLEPQRTNLALWSESFDNATWLKIGTTITANNAVSPDGYTNADALVENTATSLHDTYQAFVSASSTAYTFSCYIKPSTRTRAYLRSDTSAGTVRTLFDLTGSGSVVTLAHTSASISLVGNGWYRCSITFTEGTGAAGRLVFVEGAVDTSINYAGNGLTAFWLYGAQLEAGSYATSYIPTLGASVTRGADAMTDSTFTALPNPNFTIFFEVDDWSGSDGNNYQFRFIPSSGARSIQFRNRTDGWRWLIVNDAGGSVYLNAGSTTYKKMACRYNGTNYQLFANGSAVGAPFAATDSLILTNLDYFAIGIMGVKKMLCFPTALTNQELQDLTTL